MARHSIMRDLTSKMLKYLLELHEHDRIGDEVLDSALRVLRPPDKDWIWRKRRINPSRKRKQKGIIRRTLVYVGLGTISRTDIRGISVYTMEDICHGRPNILKHYPSRGLVALVMMWVSLLNLNRWWPR